MKSKPTWAEKNPGLAPCRTTTDTPSSPHAATGPGGSAGAAIAPDWWLGLTPGVGGLAGTYAGAALRGRVPERWTRGVLGTLVSLLALRYIL